MPRAPGGTHHVEAPTIARPLARIARKKLRAGSLFFRQPGSASSSQIVLKSPAALGPGGFRGPKATRDFALAAGERTSGSRFRRGARSLPDPEIEHALAQAIHPSGTAIGACEQTVRPSTEGGSRLTDR
jgi:hypothetical protein